MVCPSQWPVGAALRVAFRIKMIRFSWYPWSCAIMYLVSAYACERGRVRLTFLREYFLSWDVSASFLSVDTCEMGATGPASRPQGCLRGSQVAPLRRSCGVWRAAAKSRQHHGIKAGRFGEFCSSHGGTLRLTRRRTNQMRRGSVQVLGGAFFRCLVILSSYAW